MNDAVPGSGVWGTQRARFSAAMIIRARGAGSLFAEGARAYYGEHAQSYAAAIAFYALFSFFPMALVVVAAGTLVLGQESRQDQLITAVVDNVLFLGEGDRGQLRDSLSTMINNRGPVGFVGGFFALYAGSAFFGSIRTGLTAVLGRGNTVRPQLRQLMMFFARKLVDAALALLTIAVLVASVTSATAASFAQTGSGEPFGWGISGSLLLALSVALAVGRAIIIALLCAAAFLSVAGGSLGWRSAAVGALVTAVAFELLALGFTQFAVRFANFDATYGALGFVIALLAYIYLAAQSLLFGAEVAKAHADAGMVPRPASDG